MSSQDLRKRLVASAKNEVGVLEVGNNRGKEVEKYQAADWLDGTGYAWCASFVCWNVQQAQDDEQFKRPQTAGAWDFENWVKGKYGAVGMWRLIKPASEPVKAGDIVVFTFSHIGIAVADEHGGYVETVEGNTNSEGSREGDGVWNKMRKKSLIRSIIRYGR